MTFAKFARSFRTVAVLAALGSSTVVYADSTKTVPPDNTAQNAGDRQGDKPTADQSKNGKRDLDLTAQIRRSVMADKGLSTSAHNVKIIVESGVVTLKGPVKTSSEKTVVEKKASDIAGASNVRNQIEVAP